MATLKHDAIVGRLLLIDGLNPPDLTSEEFMSYINEGFVPMFYTNTSNPPMVSYQPAFWQLSENGSVSLFMDGQETATFHPKDYVPADPGEGEN